MRSLLRSQRLRPANEWIPPLVESVELAYLARDADPDAVADGAGASYGSAQPERALRAQVNAVISFVDIHCFREPPGAASKVYQTLRSAMTLHQRDAFQGFKRAP